MTPTKAKSEVLLSKPLRVEAQAAIVSSSSRALSMSAVRASDLEISADALAARASFSTDGYCEPYRSLPASRSHAGFDLRSVRRGTTSPKRMLGHAVLFQVSGLLDELVGPCPHAIVLS